MVLTKGVDTVNDKTGNAATRAKNKFNAKAYDRLYPFVKKGKKEVYVSAAKRAGVSLNEFIETALDEKAAKV
jgi:predicted HicB family RNase H-like nuclease